MELMKWKSTQRIANEWKFLCSWINARTAWNERWISSWKVGFASKVEDEKIEWHHHITILIQYPFQSSWDVHWEFNDPEWAIDQFAQFYMAPERGRDSLVEDGGRRDVRTVQIWGRAARERGCKHQLLRSYESLCCSLSSARFGLIVGIEHSPSLVTIEMFSWESAAAASTSSLSGSAGHVATREKRRERVIERWASSTLRQLHGRYFRASFRDPWTWF